VLTSSAIWWFSNPVGGVEFTNVTHATSPDGKGTDVSATVTNARPVTVDVLVRVRGYDVANRAVVDEVVGPFRNVVPGSANVIDTYLQATPLESVTLEPYSVSEVIRAARSP
jgi:hypothetical protein